ncbi:hypothetical protein ACN20G_11055 [Streptomyces sp. BI20]|uniref:hypothetical protein n=1 Tax=Streptomyces sp. BI20 TaxID=3403460 RepID=UPI003C731E5B
MPRPLALLGTLAATAVLALGLTAPAQAATGELHVNGVVFSEPSGCIPAAGPKLIRNNTDNPVLVTNGPWCTGLPLAVVAPGETFYAPEGNALFVR